MMRYEITTYELLRIIRKVTGKPVYLVEMNLYPGCEEYINHKR